MAINHWSEDDISEAIKLRSLSLKSYKYLREKCKFPFPSVTTLNRWAAKFHVESGILHPVLKVLQHKAESRSERDRVCVMSFDECSTAKE